MRKFVAVSVSLVIWLVGCASQERVNEEEMLTLASATTKLSAAVESTCRYKNPPAGLADGELLVLATAHDTSLLAPTSNRVIKARCENRHGVVLVCDAAAKRALIEDSACTAALDRHAWKEGNNGCDFQLTIASICNR